MRRFPAALHSIVEDQSNASIIAWWGVARACKDVRGAVAALPYRVSDRVSQLPDHAVVILKKAAFVRNVLPAIASTCRWRSFLRQLSHYGFERARGLPYEIFVHEAFRPGDPVSVTGIKRGWRKLGLEESPARAAKRLRADAGEGAATSPRLKRARARDAVLADLDAMYTSDEAPRGPAVVLRPISVAQPGRPRPAFAGRAVGGGEGEPPVQTREHASLPLLMSLAEACAPRAAGEMLGRTQSDVVTVDTASESGPFSAGAGADAATVGKSWLRDRLPAFAARRVAGERKSPPRAHADAPSRPASDDRAAALEVLAAAAVRAGPDGAHRQPHAVRRASVCGPPYAPAAAAAAATAPTTAANGGAHALRVAAAQAQASTHAHLHATSARLPASAAPAAPHYAPYPGTFYSPYASSAGTPGSAHMYPHPAYAYAAAPPPPPSGGGGSGPGWVQQMYSYLPYGGPGMSIAPPGMAHGAGMMGVAMPLPMGMGGAGQSAGPGMGLAHPADAGMAPMHMPMHQHQLYHTMGMSALAPAMGPRGPHPPAHGYTAPVPFQGQGGRKYSAPLGWEEWKQ